MKKALILVLAVLALLIQESGTCTETNEVKQYDQVKDFTISPWKMYPELEHKSMGWRMGYGEYYILRWHKYFRALQSKAREDYKVANPEPKSWEGFYDGSEKRYIKLESRLKN